MERRGPSHSGPYGLACKNCFNSKCRCVARADGDGCERCHRRNKPCIPSESIRRRAAAIGKKQGSNARIDDLESKLDSLLSRLESRNAIDGDPTQRQNPPPLPPSQPTQTSVVEPLDATDHETQECTCTENGDGVSRREQSALPASISDAEAEGLLGTFRSHMLHHFAFVHLPDQLTADQLQHDRPFLLRSIFCVTVPSAREKMARSKELRRTICETMLGFESQSSIDLLLGLLTYIAWGWDHLLNRRSLSRLMMQAMSLACEMRLNKPTPEDANMMTWFTPGSDAWSGSSGIMTTLEFLERQRAVLGCFALSSTVSAYFEDIDPLR